MASVAHLGPTHLGLDVHNNTISVAILAPDHELPEVDRTCHDEPSVRRLVGRLGDPRRLRACSQHRPNRLRAGPAAAQHGRRLPGDRALADPHRPRRRAQARLAPRSPAGAAAPRAGELVAIHIPTPAEEAVGDLCRARADLVGDRTRARHRLSKFRYVNVAEWESADHFRKAAASPEFQQRISGMSVRAHPALYRVVIQ